MERRRLLDPVEHAYSFTHELINEKWSRSEEIDQAVEDVYDAIGESTQPENLVKVEDGVEFLKGNCNCTVFGMDIQIVYFIYNTTDSQIMEYVYKNAEKYNGYDENLNKLFLTLYLINGHVCVTVCTKIITHEVEHLLQISLAKKNNKKYNELVNDDYKFASSVISGEEPSNDTGKNIAWLFYLSNTHEQDAFINEYFEELKQNKQFIFDKNSETHERLKTYSRLVEWAKNSIDEEFKNELQKYRKFGYNRTTFMTMIQKGLKRFEKKMKNVEKHYQNRIKRLNEVGIHYCGRDLGELKKIRIH